MIRGELIDEAKKLRHVDVGQGQAMSCVEVAGKVAMWQKVEGEKKANSSGIPRGMRRLGQAPQRDLRTLKR